MIKPVLCTVSHVMIHISATSRMSTTSHVRNSYYVPWLTCATASRQEIHDGFVAEVGWYWLFCTHEEVYLISPEVEVKLVHILGHPTWNELYSCHIYHCQFSPYPWLLTHHLSLAILTRRVGTRIENNYCRQASYGNVHLLRSLVEKRAMKFHVLLIKSVPP